MHKENILPEGTKDLLLDECIIKRRIEKDIDNLFNSYSFKEIITPTVEFYKTFNESFKSLDEEEMYKFFDNRGRILVLRPDMTIPIARVVQTKLKDTELPIRLRYNSKIYRVHTSLFGKQNEFTDCGIELVGNKDIESDLEMLVIALECLKKLNLKNFKLEIGNINLLKNIFNKLNMKQEEKEKIALFIEEKNLKNLEEYMEKLNIDEEYKILLNKLPWMFGDKKVFDEVKKFALNPETKKDILYLENLFDKLNELGYSKYITFDFGMAPNLNYYTGIIFRGYSEGIGDSFLRGGRYDNLIKFKNNNIPAIGFSINTDSIIDYLKSYEESNEEKICEIYYGSKDSVKAIRDSFKYREDGFIVELHANENINEYKVVLGR